MRLIDFLKDGGGRKYTDSFYDKTDLEASKKVGVPLNVLSGIRIAGERSNENQISAAGAKGVFQFIPSTRNLVLKKYGVDAWDPNQASLAAAYLLKESADRNNGDYNIAIREYHGGTNRSNWGKVNNAYANRLSNYLNGNSNYTPSEKIDINTNYAPNLNIAPLDHYSTPNSDSPINFESYTPEIQEQMLRNLRLQEQALKAEERKKETELQNLQIQEELKRKQMEKKQMLSMIPQAQSIQDSTIQNQSYNQFFNHE